MNIYTEGEFDPELAAIELKRASGMNADPARLHVATLSAAALIDIAASLKVLALDAALAIPAAYDVATVSPEPAPDIFAPGRHVMSVVDDSMVGIVGDERGVDQGEPWVSVRWLDGTEPTRVFTANLLVPTVSTIAELAEHEPPAVSDPDDIDDDFDGDRHTEATDALAALKARNKAAKKGSKK